MGMTMSEKILARESGRTEAKAGEIVTARISAAMIQDALGPIVYRQFRELGVPVWDRNRVFPVVDHNCLPGIPENAKTTDETVKFAEDYQLPYLYNMQGVSHQIMVENGKIRPGQIAVGTDSHTVTYGALGAFSTGIGSTEMCAVLATGELWFKIPETIRILASGKFSKYVMSKDLMLKILSLLGTNGAIYKTLEFCGETIEKITNVFPFWFCPGFAKYRGLDNELPFDQHFLLFAVFINDADTDCRVETSRLAFTGNAHRQRVFAV